MERAPSITGIAEPTVDHHPSGEERISVLGGIYDSLSQMANYNIQKLNEAKVIKHFFKMPNSFLTVDKFQPLEANDSESLAEIPL